LRRSFPDLEYRAHDFRVIDNESGEYTSGSSDDSATITVRFTTLTTGTFRGAPLRLRHSTIQPNGKVMKCPPTSISITYATKGRNAGKIVKLVNDVVLDRQFGNTKGLSGIAGAAICAGVPLNEWELSPPLVAMGKFFGRPMKQIDEQSGGDVGMPPFPDSVMIQLAKGVTASSFGLDDPDLLSIDFTYLEPLMGPLKKEAYVELFTTKYNVRDAVPDLDYQFQNYRVDPYDPFRVWVDTRAKGTRIGPIGAKALPANIQSAKFESPPECMSFTFDADGYCTRITAASVLDPLLGNTGLLGGVYGILYATGTPEIVLKTRTVDLILNRSQKAILKEITGVGVDGYRLTDGRVVNGLPGRVLALPSSLSASSTPFWLSPSVSESSEEVSKPPTSASGSPFFAEISSKKKSTTLAIPKSTPTISLGSTKSTATDSSLKPYPPKASSPVSKLSETNPEFKAATKTTLISTDPQDPVTEAFSSFFGTTEVTDGSVAPTSPVESADTTASGSERSKIQQLKEAAQIERQKAAEAKQKADAINAETEKTKTTASSAISSTPNESSKESSILSFVPPSPKAVATPSKSSPSKTSSPTALTPTKKSSPTFNLFSSSFASSSTTQTTSKGASKTTAISSSPKRSSTLSLFGSSPLPKATVAKPKPKGSTQVNRKPPVKTKRATTFSIAGVGGGPVPKKKAKKQTPKTKAAPTTQQKETQSPPFNLFGGGNASSNKSVSFTPKATSASTGFSFRMSAPKKATVENKTPAMTSPTFSLFVKEGRKSVATQPAKPPPKAAKSVPSDTAANKSPTFNLFGSIESTSSSTKQTPRKASLNSKSTVESSSKKEVSSFGELFGGGGGTEKSFVSKSTTPSAPKGVPTLRQWKVNEDGSIEARIYDSLAFRQGMAITTSPIGNKKSISKGNVVQTKSGSKYYLE